MLMICNMLMVSFLLLALIIFSYDSRDYQWYSGTEGSFTLRTNGYIVYSDIGDYPVLARDSMYLYAVMFLGVIFLLFTLYRSFFNPGRVVI